MTEQNEQQPEQTQETQQQAELSKELRELGQQLEQAFRGVVEGENAKKLQRDFVSGLREIGVQMQTGLSSLKENPRVQTLTERGQQVVNQAQESQASRDFQESLARGVAFLREQIASFNERQKTEAVAPTSDSQTVTIEREEENPATGETTRLEPDKSE
jgi:hypothetical protein